MDNLSHYVSARAYEREAGGFRGLAREVRFGQVLTSSEGPIRASLVEAKNDAKRFARKLLGERPHRTGYQWGKHSWTCNHFVRL